MPKTIILALLLACGVGVGGGSVVEFAGGNFNAPEKSKEKGCNKLRETAMPIFEVWVEAVWEVDAQDLAEAERKVKSKVSLGNTQTEDWSAYDPNDPPPQGFRG
jgi:hypothetical protein